MSVRFSLPGNRMRLGVDPVPRRVTRDDLSLALYEISVRADDNALVSLSQTPLWKDVERATRDQNWWYRRTVALVKQDLVHRSGDWHAVYASLTRCGLQFKRCQNYGSLLLVEVLLEIGADPSQNSLTMMDVVREGNIEVVKLLLADGRINLSLSGSVATERGFIEILKLLLDDPRGANTGDLWDTTLFNEREDVAAFLLKDRRVDPSVHDNFAIRDASERGLTEIVRMLLEDNRVDPSAQNLQAVRSAIKNGFSDVLLLLLQDARVAVALPVSNLQEEIYEAAMRGKAEVLRLIFNTEYISDDIERVLSVSVKVSDNLEVIKLLLDQLTVDILDEEFMSDLIRSARTRRRREVETLLLEYWEMLKKSR